MTRKALSGAGRRSHLSAQMAELQSQSAVVLDVRAANCLDFNTL